jgi:hypothetical protein
VTVNDNIHSFRIWNWNKKFNRRVRGRGVQFNGGSGVRRADHRISTVAALKNWRRGVDGTALGSKLENISLHLPQ